MRCTTFLAFAFVLGVLVFVHELGHFLVARWHGVRVLTFSLGFGPKLLTVPPRRHRVLPQRHPARRLREDGRREPRRPAHRQPRRVPVEEQVAALPDPDHGPAMNIVLAVLAAGRRADAGRSSAGLPQPAGAHRRGAGRDRRRAGAGCSPATTHRASRPRDVATWEELEIGRDLAAPNATWSSWSGAAARSGALTIRPTTTEVPPHSDTTLRSRHDRRAARRLPGGRAVIPGDPAEQAGLKHGRRDPVDRRQAHGLLAQRVRGDLASSAEQPIADPGAPRRRRADRSPSRRGAGRGQRRIGINIGNETDHLHARRRSRRLA